MLGKIIRYWRDGTLGERIRRRLDRQRRLRTKVRWFGADSVDEAMRALRAWGIFHAGDDGRGWVLCLGPDSPERQRLLQDLQAADAASHGADASTLDEVLSDHGVPSAVLCAATVTADITELASLASGHPLLTDVPFEYVEGVTPEHAHFREWDEYPETFFVSPVLRDRPGPYAIYARSLQHFAQKCGLRDYLDLYQMLGSIADRDIDGDVAEFGSFKGHSGWLIAESLKALGQERQLHMFDMFEHFPSEDLGIDRFWSNTHTVDFAEVQGKLADYDNVQLVKGDFTQTLHTSEIGRLALAYVDCDSYRATRYLFETLLADYLVPGGVLICEDYGHPALLGSRLAVHEVLDQRKDLVRFFSQFSGLYIAVKVA